MFELDHKLVTILQDYIFVVLEAFMISSSEKEISSSAKLFMVRYFELYKYVVLIIDGMKLHRCK